MSGYLTGYEGDPPKASELKISSPIIAISLLATESTEKHGQNILWLNFYNITFQDNL